MIDKIKLPKFAIINPMWSLSRSERRYVESLGLLSFLCLVLLFARAITTGVQRYWFIPENLVLAWLGLGFGWLLVKGLQTRSWRSWQNITLSILWLFFLPNTWYVLTDFIHVYPTGEISELFDIVLMSSLVLCGFIMGLTSLLMVHKELLKRIKAAGAYTIIEAVILLASFGIYLGRDLRWSTWDVLTDPSGIIINVSDRVVDPLGHPSAINVTALFFVLLTTIYFGVYRFWQSLPTSKSDK